MNHYKNIKETLNLLINNKISPTELIKGSIKRTKKINQYINAFLNDNNKFEEEENIFNFLKKVNQLENLKRLGKIPIISFGLKNNIAIKNRKHTCGSKILKNYISPYTATCVKKILKEGGIFFGRLNLDEFGMGSSNENSSFGPVKNPWNLKMVAGGSSGGSAAAVASGCIHIALGSDTGGSVRQPASFCGIVGLKPTYGRISRYGLASFSSSMDQIGILARSVEDSYNLLKIIYGDDSFDLNTLQINKENNLKSFSKISHPDFLNYNTKKKIGIIKNYDSLKYLDKEIQNNFEDSVNFLKKRFSIKEIKISNLEFCLPIYNVISSAEATSNLARYDGIKHIKNDVSKIIDKNYQKTLSYKEFVTLNRSYYFGTEVKKRIFLGNFFLSSKNYRNYFFKSQQIRTLLCKDFFKAFKEVDVIITPTTPTTAFKIYDHQQKEFKKQEILDSRYYSDFYTAPVNLVGCPAISIPSGFSKNGMPIGIQFISNHCEEEKLIAFSNYYEKFHNFCLCNPNI
jgi:aspartyl-tRNA(Asn)/glutamyl-tRNA(Gln) amidotransferase subunit A